MQLNRMQEIVEQGPALSSQMFVFLESICSLWLVGVQNITQLVITFNIVQWAFRWKLN